MLPKGYERFMNDIAITGSWENKYILEMKADL